MGSIPDSGKGGACYVTVVIGSVAIIHLASSHLPRIKIIISHEIWARSTKAPFWTLFKCRLRPSMQRLCLFKVLLLTPPKKTSFLTRHWRTVFQWDFRKKDCFFSECINSVFISTTCVEDVLHLCVGLLAKYIEKLWMDLNKIFSNCWYLDMGQMVKLRWRCRLPYVGSEYVGKWSIEQRPALSTCFSSYSCNCCVIRRTSKLNVCLWL